jgi:hypothetical protein
METTGSAQGRARQRFMVTEAEREVADLLAIEVDPVLARATVETVPFWFHTFALNHAEGIYTPGAARDHRYRVSALPEDFAGMSVLDVAASTALTRSSPSAGGPRGSWRSTTSSTGCGSPPGGASSWRAGRASASSIACSARPLSTGGWTRSRSTGRGALQSRLLLRDPAQGREPTPAAARAAWANGGSRHGADRDLRRRPGRSRRPRDPHLGTRGGLRARRVRLLGVRGRRPGAARQDCGLKAVCRLATSKRARVARVRLCSRRYTPTSMLPHNRACASFSPASPLEPARPASVKGTVAPGEASVSSKPGPITLLPHDVSR